jgi:hypothetical protein
MVFLLYLGCGLRLQTELFECVETSGPVALRIRPFLSFDCRSGREAVKLVACLGLRNY